MIRYILLIFLIIFFAVNMGASGVAPSFASAYGGRLIKKKTVFILFALFVVLGAVTLGRGVSATIGKSLIPREFMDFDAVLAILSAAALGLFLANILKIPQSTSQVTVGAVVGAGVYFKHLNTATLFFRILPMWFILPLLSYVLTWLIYRKIYPPKHDNMHIYQRLFNNEKRLRMLAIAAGCYVAFAIGSNNVANAVGPLFGAGIVGVNLGLILISPFFGLGAFLLGKGTLNTAGKEIVPLGVFSSTLISFVTATLLIVASILGIPQSLVQLNVLSIFAVSCQKDGHKHTMDKRLTKKTFSIWAITPMISFVLSYVLLGLINLGG